MELVKHVIGSETVYIPKLESITNNTFVLLGFKNNLPVLSNTMNESKPSIRKTVKIEINNRGEKFIMVNGKKIKILAESEIPKNSQIIKIATMQSIAQSPTKFNLIKNIPKKQTPKPNLPKLMPITVDKKITSQLQITNKVPFIENKFLKIPISSAEPIVANTTDKCGIGADNMKIVQCTSGKHIIRKENPKMLNNFVRVTNASVQCAALDLTKNGETLVTYKTDVMKKDKCLQAETNTCHKEVQTDFHDDFDTFLTRVDFSDLLDDSNLKFSMTPKRIPDENLGSDSVFDVINDLSNEYTTLNSASSKSIEILKNYHKKDKEMNFFKELRGALQVDDQGNLPIHIGVLKNDLKLVKRSCFILKILQQNVNITNNNEMSPLQLAILNDSSIDIISFLLENGAKIGVNDSEGNNVLHYAVENERTEALKLMIVYAVQQRLNLDQHNNGGLTPLMICCLNSYHDCAEILLEADADPNVKDQISGRTALFHASELHDVDMVEMLLQFNACTKIKNFFGTSPHDAMYEIDDMPDAIKYMILGKNNKRKSEESTRPSKFQKKIDKNRRVLKTYARLEKISYSDFKIRT